jgi:hypothetical protein
MSWQKIIKNGIKTSKINIKSIKSGKFNPDIVGFNAQHQL